jgi:peptidoglycan/xylan/chitin deacetylase (PgdA/CDA1 family)
MTSLARRAIKKILRLSPVWTYPLYCRVQGIRTKNLGISRGIVCLSFDNDYAADNEAAENLLPLFQSYRIPVTWAVIGLWVKKYIHLHQQLLNSGNEN